MSVSVQCPDCRTTLRTKPDRLGRRGQCPGCGLVFLLASPVGERLIDDEPEAPEVIEELPILTADPEPPPPPTEQPPPGRRRQAAAAPTDDDDSSAKQRRRKKSSRAKPQRTKGAPWVLVAILAFGLLVVGSAVIFLAAQSNRPNDSQFALFPPKSEPKSGSIEPLILQPAAPPGPIPLADATNLNFDGPVAAIYPSGGGQYVVFHLSPPGRLVIYDVAKGRVTGTIERIESNVQIGVGRSKVFVGNWMDGLITRYDLRTGASEAVTRLPIGERITHLAIGAGSDGPLVVGASTADHNYQVRLFDTELLTSIEAAIIDPAGDTRSFPFAKRVGASHIAVSADGRAISISDRLYLRTTTGYRAVPINPSSGLRPSPDGTVLLGNSLIGEDGRVIRFDNREIRWLLPAVDGPFFLSFEYGQRQNLRLFLHTDQNPKPLGELPIPEELTTWFTTSGGNAVSLYRHLAYLPEPGLIVFAAPKSRMARFLPVNLPAILTKAGREMIFTSVPPVAVPRNGQFYYSATAITKNAQRPTYRVETAPSATSITSDGLLFWSAGFHTQDRPADFQLAASTPDGNKVVQRFRLFLPGP